MNKSPQHSEKTRHFFQELNVYTYACIYLRAVIYTRESFPEISPGTETDLVGRQLEFQLQFGNLKTSMFSFDTTFQCQIPGGLEVQKRVFVGLVGRMAGTRSSRYKNRKNDDTIAEKVCRIPKALWKSKISPAEINSQKIHILSPDGSLNGQTNMLTFLTTQSV